MSEFRPIGTVETFRGRQYALDAEMHSEPLATWVSVNPGVYTLYSNGLSTFWMMKGQIVTNYMNRMGDGMFSVGGPMTDDSRPEVVFPSRVFGIDEWDDFVNRDVTTREGHPEQRVRILIDQAAIDGYAAIDKLKESDG